MIRESQYSRIVEIIKSAISPSEIQKLKDQRILKKFKQEDEIPEILYHATTGDPESIKQRGLIKSYQDNIGIEAVYFFKTEINARHILNHIISRYNRPSNNKYIVQISTKVLGPFYRDFYSSGIFLPESVPPSSILDIEPMEQTEAFKYEKELEEKISPFKLQGIETDPTSYNIVFPDDSEIYGKVDTAQRKITIQNFQWKAESEQEESYDLIEFKQTLESLGYSVFIN